MMKTVLFVGLGRMGWHMARQLGTVSGIDITVANRTHAKAEEWRAENGGNILNLQDIGDAQFDVVCLCVGNDEDVRNTLIGKVGLSACVKKGGVVIDHTTTSAILAYEMYTALADKDIGFLDAPVSGGEAGAINGQLTCMLGGNKADYDGVQLVLNAYCKTHVYIGKSGTGQISKMANQICILGILAGLSEAITLLKHQDIDTDKVLQAISGGAAQSWQMDNRFTTMVTGAFDFGFAVDHAIKDVTYAIAHAKNQGWTPEISTIILGWYQHLSEQGRNTQDTSTLINHYRRD